MPDFSMTKYYSEYIAAETEARRLRDRVGNLRSALAVVGDEDMVLELLERLEEPEAAAARAREEADRLRCKATTGKSPEELSRDNQYREVERYGGARPHWPGQRREV